MPRATIGIVFDNYGPYHCARAEAAARVLDVVAIELRRKSETYGWAAKSGDHTFRKVTVADGAPGEPLQRGLRKRLDTALRDVPLDAICVNGWGDAGAPAVIAWARAARCPVIFMSESAAMDHTRAVWREAVKRRIVGMGAAGLVGGSPHAAYLEQLGMPAERIFAGYDAIDNDHFARGADDARANESEHRRALNLPAHYFLASARFVAKKNLPFLMEAFAQYRERTTRTETERCDLVLLGDGPLQDELIALTRRLGIRDHVHLPGFRQYPELPAYYGLADAFIHPSTTEQWGLVVNEAMAAALPVLVSNRCGCAPDLVENGVNGFTFDPADLGKLVAHLLALSDDAALRERMAGASRKRIADWGPQRFAEGLLDAVTAARQLPHRGNAPMDSALLWLLQKI